MLLQYYTFPIWALYDNLTARGLHDSNLPERGSWLTVGCENNAPREGLAARQHERLADLGRIGLF